MLNFRKGFEFLFKSFDISWDTKILKKLEQDWHRFLMVIKKHWIYSIFNLRIVFFVIIITIINLTILFWWNYINILIWLFLLLNILYWIFVIFSYIYKFYKINWSSPCIEDIYTAINKSIKSDEIFSKFFNQTIFLFIILFLITIFSIISSIFYIIKWNFWFWIQLSNVFLFIIEVILFYMFLLRMINQEMDFKIIIPWQIMFFDQKWILWDSQNMNASKIKTINTEYSGLLWSLLNYWDILILSEWDQWWNWQMRIDFVWNPNNTVKEIEKILQNDLKLIEKNINIIFKKIKNELWINDIKNNEDIIKLKEYVKQNEQKIKELFEKWNEEIRNEIKELYYILINYKKNNY